MEQIVGQILSCPQKDKDLRNLLRLLKKNEQIVLVSLNHVDSALQHLDVTKHSLGYTFLLATKCQHLPKEANLDVVFNQASLLFENGHKAQCQLASEKFAALCEALVNIAQRGNVMRAIRPLQSAIALIQPTPKHLTPAHAALLRACLQSHAYYAGVAVAEKNLLLIDSAKTGMRAVDVLLYHYYAGLIFIGEKKFRKAMDMLQRCFTAPANVLSAIMVEAYKKFMLVSLIHIGKVEGMPKYASQMTETHLRHAVPPPYQELQNAYSTNSVEEVQKVVEKHLELFGKDKNFGLIKQVIKSLYRSNIKRQTRVFLTLSLSDIQQSANLQSEKEAEATLLRMIENGQLFAAINQQEKVVEFQDAAGASARFWQQKLSSQLTTAIELNNTVTAIDEEVIKSQDYCIRQFRGSGGGGMRGFGDFEESGMIDIMMGGGDRAFR